MKPRGALAGGQVPARAGLEVPPGERAASSPGSARSPRWWRRVEELLALEEPAEGFIEEPSSRSASPRPSSQRGTGWGPGASCAP